MKEVNYIHKPIILRHCASEKTWGSLRVVKGCWNDVTYQAKSTPFKIVLTLEKFKSNPNIIQQS